MCFNIREAGRKISISDSPERDQKYLLLFLSSLQDSDVMPHLELGKGKVLTWHPCCQWCQLHAQ